MFRDTCSFCAHPNPEGSKFCNECGSPLHLVPCRQCEAINNRADEQCSRCGAPLSSDAAQRAAGEAVASPDAAAVESSALTDDPVSNDTDAMQPAASAGGSVPIALADRMDDFPWATPRARAPTPIAGERVEPIAAGERDEPVATPAAIDEIASQTDEVVRADYSPGRAYYDARKPRRAPSIMLALLLVGVAGAVYWSSLSPSHPSHAQPEPGVTPVEAPAPTAVAPAASNATPEVKGEARDATRNPPPAAASRETQLPASPQPASSSANAAAQPAPAQTGRTAEAPSATSQPSRAADAPAATSQPSRAATAPAATSEPARTATAPPAPAEPATTAAPPAPSEAAAADSDTRAAKAAARRSDELRRRPPPYMRTREQAERDAQATQRLIARDLGTAPPANAPSGTAPER